MYVRTLVAESNSSMSCSEILLRKSFQFGLESKIEEMVAMTTKILQRVIELFWSSLLRNGTYIYLDQSFALGSIYIT